VSRVEGRIGGGFPSFDKRESSIAITRVSGLSLESFIGLILLVCFLRQCASIVMTKNNKMRGKVSFVARVLDQANSRYYPFLVASLSCVNVFLMVLSGVTAALYLGGIMVRGASKDRGNSLLDSVGFAVVINAVGTAIGCAVFAHTVEVHGVEFAERIIPGLFDSNAWATTKGWVDRYGFGGVLLSSTLPLIPHPTILVCKLANMNTTGLIFGIFIGRVIKYSLMAYCALHAPRLLKFFGVRRLKID